MSDSQITSTAYEPDDELRELLDDELASVTVSYDADEEIDLPGGFTALQRDYVMTLGSGDDEFTLSGTETTSTLGMFISLEGNLGFASGIVLNHALILGEPTQIYTDEGLPANPSVEQYQDLTAEWYPPDAVDSGIPKARLEQRVVDLEHAELTVEQVEQYATHWLSQG